MHPSVCRGVTKRATYGQGSLTQLGPRKFRLRWSEGKDPFTGKHLRYTLTIDGVVTKTKAGTVRS